MTSQRNDQPDDQPDAVRDRDAGIPSPSMSVHKRTL